MAKPPGAAVPESEPTEPITAATTAKAPRTARTAKLPAAAAEAPATAKLPAAAAEAPATAKLPPAKAPATAKTATIQPTEVAAAAPAVEEPVTPVPVVKERVDKGPLRPRVAAAALRFAAVAFVATALTPLFFYLSIPFPGSLFVITASPYAFYVPFGIVLIALVVAAVAFDRPPPIKMAAILLVVIGAAVIVLSLVIPLPVLALFVPIPFFLSWALTAGFRGLGYLGLVFALVLIAVQWLSGTLISWGALFAIPAVVIAVVTALAIAGTAALERVSALRQGSAA